METESDIDIVSEMIRGVRWSARCSAEDAEQRERDTAHAWLAWIHAMLATRAAGGTVAQVPTYALLADCSASIAHFARSRGYTIAVAHAGMARIARDIRDEALADPVHGPVLKHLMKKAGIPIQESL